jgi:hypothetical protein
MPIGKVEGGTDFRPQDEVPDISSIDSMLSDPLEHLAPTGYLGERKDVEAELDLIAASIRTFHRLQPDQVLRYCAGYTARLTEMTVLLHRAESRGREYTRLRTQQVAKYIDELDRQWKTASRLVEVMRQDLQLSGHSG